jgi:hypothetical protein
LRRFTGVSATHDAFRIAVSGTGNQKVLVNFADEIAVMMPGAGHRPRTFCCGSAHAVIGEKAL